ncbi:MAG: thiamine pyrophosphate-dependent dehydrogenase E1 component subunit alpha [Nitrospira sp.]|nr:thiamine pyrophosphate-dependent dehydrogenase E1 component subunit alpha [Nitrospira sp.]
MDPVTPRDLYGRMLRIRLVEEKIAELYPEQQMRCPVHLSIGQEAVAVGACAALAIKDYAFSTHRSHAHYLAKGGNLKAMLGELYGRVTGCCLGKGGSMHLIDRSAGFLGAVPIVGSTIPIGVGAAFGTLLRKERRVTLVFLGDGATEEGVFHEAVNFAVLKRLPVVFVCENNFFSVYSSLDVRQPPAREIYEMARGYGLESHQGDGNDVEAVYGLTKAAVEKARTGGGPTFLEFKTYRWREHCGPHYDNHVGYRSEQEFEEWKARCPVTRLKQQLLQQGLLAQEDLDGIEAALIREIETAVVFAQSSPFPEPQLLGAHLYAP